MEYLDLIRWLDRNGRCCFYCGGPFEFLDHVIPKARGGAKLKNNTVPACRSCNSRKGARTLEEFRDKVNPGLALAGWLRHYGYLLSEEAREELVDVAIALHEKQVQFYAERGLANELASEFMGNQTFDSQSQQPASVDHDC